VAVEQEHGSGTVAGESGSDTHGCGSLDLHAGEVTVACQSFDVDIPVINDQPVVSPASCEVLLHIDFCGRPAHRRNLQQGLEVLTHRGEVEVI
jgi:hypothetical protein